MHRTRQAVLGNQENVIIQDDSRLVQVTEGGVLCVLIIGIMLRVQGSNDDVNDGYNFHVRERLLLNSSHIGGIMCPVCTSTNG